MYDVYSLIDPEDRRIAFDVFLSALHKGPMTNQEWDEYGQSDDEHWLGVKGGGGEILGAAHSFPTWLTLPGGARVAAAAVTGVGVRSDATRAGRLTALMRAQLGAARDRGEIAAILHATQTPIYGRFGYGIVSRAENVRINAGSEWRTGDASTGQVRMLGRDEAATLLPGLQERLAGERPGGMTRTPRWWRRSLSPMNASAPGFTGAGHQGIAVHTGSTGDDGFVVWCAAKVSPDQDWAGEIGIQQLWASSKEATVDLWQFLTGLDLLESVRGWSRPLDENLDLTLADSRQHQITGRSDDLWMRIVDLSAALSARAWGPGESIVVRLHDPYPLTEKPEVSTWQIGPEGVKPAKGALPDVECSLSALMPAFLGDRTPSTLIASGLWTEHTSGAAGLADTLFTTPGPAPWSGTWF